MSLALTCNGNCMDAPFKQCTIRSSSPLSSIASSSPVHKLLAFSPWLNCCNGVTLSLSPCANTGQILYVRSGYAFLSASSTPRAWIWASADRRVPMLMGGNRVLTDVFAACGVGCEGVCSSEAVAEAIAVYSERRGVRKARHSIF